MTVGFVRTSVMEVGGYPNIRLREDYGLWARFLASKYRICNIEDVLVEAAAGDSMIRRRGGLENLHAELKLQTLMLQLRVQSPAKAVMFGTIRALAFLLPVFVRKRIYRLYLREPVQSAGGEG